MYFVYVVIYYLHTEITLCIKQRNSGRHRQILHYKHLSWFPTNQTRHTEIMNI
jgi:hypothetical protein